MCIYVSMKKLKIKKTEIFIELNSKQALSSSTFLIHSVQGVTTGRKLN